jgi:peptidoglycan/xylan/chitin deacetylase (PgdA/CDA1 family)
MLNYWVKTPAWLKRLFPKELCWHMPVDEPAVYITFDDGPHPTATPFVLEQLRAYNAKASFFCIGKNVLEQPEIFRQIMAEGHTIGNHTHNHLNGWKTETATYLENVQQASQNINAHILRPPYGRIKISQAKALINATPAWTVYMWDVLSADFDTDITPQTCLDNVINNIEPGSIVVFHDSQKAWERMSYALPRVLEYCREKNWQVKALPQN